MTVLNQTTTIDCQPSTLFKYLLQPTEVVPALEDRPSLYLSCAEPVIGQGEKIHNTLQYGLFQVKWESKITKFVPDRFIEHQLSEGPFEKWVHRQQFESFGHKTLIKDEIDFIASSELEPMLQCLVVSYHPETFLEERTKKKTKKIQLIRRLTA